MKKIFLVLALSPLPCFGGPYIEFEADYNPEPESEYQQNFINGQWVDTARIEASNYVGSASFGWEWDVNSLMTGDDSLIVRLKAFEHQSDILNDGNMDVVSKNKIRGLSVKYRFW
jgi:hypothetical protein